MPCLKVKNDFRSLKFEGFTRHTVIQSDRHRAWNLCLYSCHKTAAVLLQGAGSSVRSTIVFKHKKFGLESWLWHTCHWACWLKTKEKLIHFSLNQGLENHCKQGVKIKVFAGGVHLFRHWPGNSVIWPPPVGNAQVKHMMALFLVALDQVIHLNRAVLQLDLWNSQVSFAAVKG